MSARQERPTDSQSMLRVDGDVIWIDNGRLRLGVAPTLGGRLLALCVGDAEFLWRNPTVLDDRLRYVGEASLSAATTLGDWVNLGGDKTWPAPQGWGGADRWAGPPDPVLDAGAYRSSWEEDAGRVVLDMTSGADPRTGLQITRRLEVVRDEPRLTLRLTFDNVGDQAVRWSIWNVTQLPLGLDGHPQDGVYAGVEPGPLDIQDVVTGTGLPHPRRLGPRLVHIPPSDAVGKIGLPTATGWVAHVGRAGTLTWRFDVDDTATYPDSGSRVEVWQESPQATPIPHLGDLQPSQAVVEVEVLGPLVELRPGESTSMTVQLQASAAREPIVGVPAAGLVHRELALDRREDGSLVLTGRMTGLEPGTLVAVDGSGAAVPAGQAGVGTPINLDVPLGSPEPTSPVNVVLRGATVEHPVATLTVPPAERPARIAGVDGLSAYNGRGLLAQVVEHLGRAIVGRDLPPGSTIDLDALAERFSVSRSVLREALRVLTAKGLVEARQRRGTTVRGPTSWSRLDADVLRWRVETSDLAAVTAELDELRAAIEPAAAGLAARRRSDQDLEAMDAALDVMADSWRSPEDAVAADLAFHRALLIAAHNELLAAMTVVLEAALAARNRAVHASPHVRDPVPLHARVVDAIRAHDPDRAVEAVNDLLSTARQDASRVVEPSQESNT